MTKHCDKCNKIIQLGQNHIEVSSFGIKDKDFVKLFGSNTLDFCNLFCLTEFWSEKKKNEKVP